MTITVGLDVGRDAHAYEILSSAKEILGHGVLPNATWAFAPWADMVDSYGDKVRLVVESGNGLSTPIEHFARSRGCEVAATSALTVKNYREHILGDLDKTDQTDARAIGMLGADSAISLRCPSQPRRTLRRIARGRDRLVKEKTQLANGLRQLLAELWPELTAEVAPKLDTPALLHLLICQPDPSELASLGLGAVQTLLAGAKIKTRTSFIEKLLNLAKQYRAVIPPAEKETLKLEIRWMAERLRHVCQDIKRAESLLAHLAETDQDVIVLDSIPGAGIVLASAIAAEVQDIKNFPSESKLASYAGLALKRQQTGKTKNSWIPQTRANRRLKRHILQLAILSSQRHALSHAYVQRKLSQGKKPLQARRALARHLVRLIYTMLSRGEPYKDPT